jgi:hypothetical protein
MKGSARYVAALLVATVATPGILGSLRPCCQHHVPPARVVAHHCEHHNAHETVDARESGCSTIDQCVACINMPAALGRHRLPKSVFSQVHVEDISFAPITLRFVSPHSEPPPRKSAVRRASLCSFLI